MKIATICPVWQETRYLPLVLEQMALCPGPQLLLWQDQPLYWLGEGPAPHGHASDVGAIAAQFPSIEVIKLDHAPKDTQDAPFGGFASLAEWGFAQVAARGVEVVIWTDSDWLIPLGVMKEFYRRIEVSTIPKLWSMHCQHYYRNFRTLMADSDMSLGFPIERSNLWTDYREDEIVRTDWLMHHPAYALTDREMYCKVNSWGHAPLFKERRFYENEWIGGDDSKVQPKPAVHALPDDVVARLRRWNAIPVGWL